MSIKERAIEYHNNHYNCAQSVLCACGDHTGLDDKTALAISAGFGGGLRSGEVCGAVSGAVMAIGMAFPYNDSSDTAAKERIAKLTRECVEECRARYGCVRCTELKPGRESCNGLIGEMAEIAEKIISDNK